MRELEVESDNVSLFTDTRFSIDKRKLAGASVGVQSSTTQWVHA